MKLINRIMANEEAFHLVLAAIIGVIGGLVNLVFLKLVALIQWIVFQKSGDSAVLAQDLGAFLRILVPTLGGDSGRNGTSFKIAPFWYSKTDECFGGCCRWRRLHRDAVDLG